MAKDIRKIGNIKLYTIKAIKKALQVSDYTIRNAIKSKHLQCVKFGRSYLITERALNKFLNSKNGLAFSTSKKKRPPEIIKRG